VKKKSSLQRYFIFYEVIIVSFLCVSIVLISIFTTRKFMNDLYIKEVRDFSFRIRGALLKMMETGERDKFQILKVALLKESKFLKEVKFYREDGTEIGGKNRFERVACPDEICMIQKGYQTIFFYSIRNEENCRKCHSGNRVLTHVEMVINASELRSVLRKLTFLFVGVGGVFLFLLILGTQAIFSTLIEKPMGKIMEAIKEYENGLTADKIKTEDMKSREFSILLEEMLLLFRKLEKAKKELEEFYQQRMQRADKLATIGELASSVAHEIKNPLAGINGVIQVLLKDEEIPYKAKEILREILNLTARLDRTVHNLLRFSKDTPAQFRMTNINEIIKKTLFIIEQQAITSKVVLQIQLDSSIPDSLMDEEQIGHLLINIILNAIQAMPDGGKISIKTSLEERDGNKYIKVSISDTGVGIPEGIRDKIFDPFFTTRPHGTGLGLYICKRIIKAHNGEIWVESEENRGSTFYFIIPLKTDE